jgi:hypothetical protein
MKNLFKSKIDGCGTTPKFDTRMFFSVHMNTIQVTLEDCSRNELSQESTELQKQTSKENPVEDNPITGSYENENRLIQRQDEMIKALEKQISDVEQELYEKDRAIALLENELEEVCQELLEANLQ